MKDKEKKMLFGIGIVFLFLATVGFSYAYFSATITNKDVKDQVVETGTLRLTYTDGPEIKMLNIKPGSTFIKEVSVKNTGTLDTAYNLVWQELSNEITNDEMVISATCERRNANGEIEETCEGLSETAIGANIIKKNIAIESGVTHKYVITITFKEISVDQNYNQGKKFSGVLGVNEYQPTQFEKDSWTTIVTNVRNGNISNYNLGDTKEVDLGDLGKHNVRIANKSTPSECSTSGFSQTACGFVVEFEDIITEHVMNSTETNVRGWPASAMYTYLNTDIYNMLPTDLKSAIIDTTVVSGHGQGDTSNLISTDKLYLLAPMEIHGAPNLDAASNLTRQLDYYTSKNVTASSYSDAIKKLGTVASSWWLRSANFSGSYYFHVVDYSGPCGLNKANSSQGVSPAFRIG